MSGPDRRRWRHLGSAAVLLALAVALLRCGHGDGTSEAGGDSASGMLDGTAAPLDAGLTDASSGGSGGRMVAPPVPVERCPDGVYELVDSVETPAWFAEPPDECEEAPTHNPPQLYDECDPPQVLGNGPDCRPDRLARYCSGKRLTVTCRREMDCPSGWVCVPSTSFAEPGEVLPPKPPGRCERACTGEAPHECGRCDLECDATRRYCRARQEPPVPCTSGCQCGSGVCDRGSGACLKETGIPINWGDFCSPQGYPTTPAGGAWCACHGGTCVPQRDGDEGCCVLPDGGVPNAASDACKP